MADPRFFQNSGPKTLQDIVNISGAEVSVDDMERSFDDVRSLFDAGNSHVSFFDNIKYKEQLKVTKAGACFVSPEALEFVPDDTVALVSNTPYKAYALMAQAFYPQEARTFGGDVSDLAVIDATATIAKNVRIDAGAVIGKDVIVGEGSWVESNAVIGDGVEIGVSCRVGVSATISHTIIKDHSRIYTGARIGQDGFGFAIDPAGHVKVPQLGRVIINEHCEIGANTTIDRGAGPDTVIGAGTWIDNLVQIGHNVKTGRGCVIVAHVGISGSTEIGDFTVLGGQVGVAGHLKIGSGVQVAAQSGVMRDIPDGQKYMGSPAIPIKENMKQIAYLSKITRQKK